MFKHLFPLILFALPFTLLGKELPREVPRPANEGYRPMPMSPFIEKPEGINGDYRKLTITPKTLPDPLLRYRVNVFATEKETGNAYPLYLAALKEYNQAFQRAELSIFQSEVYRKLDISTKEGNEEWQRLRFKAFPVYSHWGDAEWTAGLTAEEETRLYTQTLAAVYPLLEKASKKTYIDWSDQYEYRGFATLLGPLQEWRTLTRYLASKADWEIRNGRYDDAIKTIRVGLAFSDMILESKPTSFLVGTMVGIACKGIMYDQLQRLSVQPDVPNLYPALMQLTVNQRVWLDAIQSETHWLFRQYSDDAFWESLDSLSPEQAKTALDEFVAVFASAGSADNDEAKSIWKTIMGIASYQPAKQRLLQKGFSEEDIEARTTHQIVIPFVFEEIKRTYDFMIFDASMPVGESRSAINFDEYMQNKRRSPTNYPADTVLELFTPATQGARHAFRRQTQTLDLLKIVHAIRYYAAVHDGKLPASLDEITELAVPKMCPVTATPYQYSTEGNTAIIDYEVIPRQKSRMEIVVEERSQE